VARLKELRPEIGVVVAFGQFLTQEVLDIPAHGWLNVHGSLLPHLRGAAPIARAVAAGETETGLTVQFLSLKMDCGDIVLQKKAAIGAADTAGTLEERLSQEAGPLLSQALRLVAEGKVIRTPQDENQATLAPRLTKEDGHIRWEQTAAQIHNLVRGMNPRPGAWSMLKSNTLKIWETALDGSQAGTGSVPGTIVAVQKDRGWLVRTGAGTLLVRTVQSQDGKRMNAHAYGLGHGIAENERFGSGGNKS